MDLESCENSQKELGKKYFGYMAYARRQDVA
jgi:hypothetical protein